jgi:hypothetical protein
LDLGDDVVGTGYILGPLHAVDALIAWATWPALPTSVWMSTYALSSPALTSADRADHRPDQRQL